MSPILSRSWGKMAFNDLGRKGIPLLLLHGTGCDSRDWAGLLKSLPPGQRIISMDFRGHGESTIPQEPFSITDLAGDALALLSELKVEKAVLAGHSLGGMVAMDAASRSERVAGLVLLEGWTCLSAATAFAPDHMFGGLGVVRRQAVIGKHKKVIAGFAPEAWTRFWTTVEEFSARQFLENTALPVCEVYGTLGFLADRMDRLAIPKRMQEAIAWVDGAGHYLPFVKPRTIADICRNFMHKHGFW